MEFLLILVSFAESCLRKNGRQLFKRANFLGRTGNHRILPSTRRHDPTRNFFWSPGAGVVFINRRGSLERRIDDAPGLLDVVLSGKKCGVPRHGIAEQALVRVYFGRLRMMMG